MRACGGQPTPRPREPEESSRAHAAIRVAPLAFTGFTAAWLHGVATNSAKKRFSQKKSAKKVLLIFLFFRIHKRFAYHCIKKKSLTVQTTHF
jgi:hypothetical protein